jgi:hypothetical protein
MLWWALPQKSDYWLTFGANGISAPKIILMCFDELKANGIKMHSFWATTVAAQLAEA